MKDNLFVVEVVTNVVSKTRLGTVISYSQYSAKLGTVPYLFISFPWDHRQVTQGS